MSKKKKTIDDMLQEASVSEEDQYYKIPENWTWVRMGEIVNINPTKPKIELPDEHLCSFLSMSNVNPQTGSIDELEERRFDKVKKGYTYFKEHDVLFAKITPCMENGNTVIANGLRNQFGYGSTEFYVLRTPKQVDERYIYFLLRSEKFRKQAKAVMSGAVGQQRVPKKFLETYPLALPPLNEQKRIVEKVDYLFKKIEEAKQLVEETKETFELRRASILDKAFRGELSAQWREDNLVVEDAFSILERIRTKKINSSIKSNTLKINSVTKDEEPFDLPNGWTWIRLGEISYYVTSGSRDWSKYYSNEGAMFVRTQDINKNSLNLNDVAFVSLPEKVEGKRSLVEKSDILTTITGANVGKCALVEADIKEAYVSQSVALTKLIEKSIAKYVHLSLLSPCGGGKELEIRAYGIGRPVLSLEDIKNIKIPLAPIGEQQFIVDMVEKLLANEKESMRLASVEKQLEILKQSILNKAFCGELGTNDLNDESSLGVLKEILQEKIK
ncbi:restriction endonuclease [Bacillus cereus]|nr:restriction endonuclease [Bacillus cereus]